MLRAGVLETLRVRVQSVATYVHMLCIVLYYTTCDLNTSLLSSVKVFLWKVSLCTVGLSLCCYWQVQLAAVEVRVQGGRGG